MLMTHSCFYAYCLFLLLDDRYDYHIIIGLSHRSLCLRQDGDQPITTLMLRRGSDAPCSTGAFCWVIIMG